MNSIRFFTEKCVFHMLTLFYVRVDQYDECMSIVDNQKQAYSDNQVAEAFGISRDLGDGSRRKTRSKSAARMTKIMCDSET